MSTKKSAKFVVRAVEKVRDDTHKITVDAGRDGELRIYVYPNNTMQILSNGAVQWLEADLTPKQRAMVLKAADRTSAAPSPRKTIKVPALVQSELELELDSEPIDDDDEALQAVLRRHYDPKAGRLTRPDDPSDVNILKHWLNDKSEQYEQSLRTEELREAGALNRSEARRMRDQLVSLNEQLSFAAAPLQGSFWERASS